VHQDIVAAMGLPPAPLLLNPLTVDWDALRPTMVVGLAGAAVRNLSRGREGFASFEIGKTFSIRDRSFDEETSLGILLSGTWQDTNWTTPAVSSSIFVLKGIVESILRDLHVSFAVAPLDGALLEPGAGALVSSETTSLGTLGVLRHDVGILFGLERDAFYAEFSVDALLKSVPAITFKEFSKFPSIRRDIAVLVDSSMTAGELQAIITENSGPLLKAIVVFDSFQGGSLPAGKKSVGFSMEFASPDRTLLGEEVDVLVGCVEVALASRVGGILRRTRS
jgi:phenylalanyl-tRNA synthetase beta chain